jgi:hypothetical protein
MTTCSFNLGERITVGSSALLFVRYACKCCTRGSLVGVVFFLRGVMRLQWILSLSGTAGAALGTAAEVDDVLDVVLDDDVLDDDVLDDDVLDDDVLDDEVLDDLDDDDVPDEVPDEVLDDFRVLDEHRVSFKYIDGNRLLDKFKGRKTSSSVSSSVSASDSDSGSAGKDDNRALDIGSMRCSVFM